MGAYTTEAIIIGSKNWGEADKMLRFFSRERGKFKATAFGCRRPKSPLAGTMQMLNVVEATLTEGERIDNVRQASVKRRFKAIESDFSAMAYASFIAEMVSEMEPDDVPHEEVYDFLPKVFDAMESRNPRIIAVAAGYRLLECAGVGLSLDACASCGKKLTGDAYFSIDEGGALDVECARDVPRLYQYAATTRELLTKLKHMDWDSLPTFTVKKKDLMAAEKILLDDIHQMLGRELKSLKFIEQIQQK